MSGHNHSNHELSQHDLRKWYQKGRSFQDVMNALQTSQETTLSPAELLSRNMELGWEKIWDQIGI